MTSRLRRFATLTMIFAGACSAASDRSIAPAAPAATAAPAMPQPRGPYLGEVASDVPTMFARGVVSRKFQELNAAFSPAGDELFYTLADPARSHYTLIRMAMGGDGIWSAPEVAPFSGLYSDADPIFTQDGKRLYFISRRPIRSDGAAKKDFDLWYVDRVGAGWGEPVRVPEPVNTDADEYYVAVTQNGTLYSSRKGDIFRAVPEGNSYRVEILPAAINSPSSDEGDAYVAPDESYLIFTAWGRPDSLGSGDLYVSFRIDGEWQPARTLGPAINSKAFDYCPIVSPDGKYFFFTSYRKPDAAAGKSRTIEQVIAGFDDVENGLGNVYWLKTDFLTAMRGSGEPPR